MPNNYVEVLVKSRDQAKPDLDELKTKLNDLAGRVAEARAMVDDADAAAKLDRMRAQLLALDKRTANPKISMQGAVTAEAQLHALEAQFDKVGSSSKGAAEVVDASLQQVDAKTKDTAKNAGNAGDQAGKGFISRFAAWLKPSKFQVVTTALSSALATLPALGAIAGTGIVLDLGATVAAGIPSVQKEFKSLGATVSKTMDSAIKPMLPAISAVATQIGSFVKSIGPQLTSLFAAVAPALMPLTKGLEQLVQGLLPGLLAIVKAAMPAILTLSGILAHLGSDLGGIFQALAPAVGASANLLQGIGQVLDTILPIVAQVAASLAKSLEPAIVAFAGALVDVAPAISAIGEIMGKLAGAVLTSLAGALEALAHMVQAVAPAFGVLASVLGDVFTALENSGVFGILEDAIESLAAPLGKLISTLITAFAPVLGQLLSLVAQVASVLGADLVHAAVQLLPVITAMVPMLAQIATALLQVLEQAIVPLLPQISQLMQMMTRFLIQAITPLMPAITQLALALIKILMAVTPLLPPLMRLVTLGMELQVKAIMPLRGPLVVLANALTGLATAISVVVGWIARFIAHAIDWVTHLGNIKKAASDVFGWISGHWAALLFGLLTLPFTKALPEIKKVLGDILSGAKNDLGDVISFLAGLPGQFVSALAGLYGDMVKVGGQVISGIWDGIKGAAGGLKKDVGGFVSDVTGWFTSGFGILSPSRVMSEKVGKHLPSGIGLGVTQNLAPLKAAVRHAVGVAVTAGQAGMGSVGAAGYAGYGGAGAAGATHVVLDIQGADSEFIAFLRKAIRARGGGGPNSVQRALGQVA